MFATYIKTALNDERKREGACELWASLCFSSPRFESGAVHAARYYIESRLDSIESEICDLLMWDDCFECSSEKEAFDDYMAKLEQMRDAYAAAARWLC